MKKHVKDAFLKNSSLSGSHPHHGPTQVRLQCKKGCLTEKLTDD